MKKYIVTIKNIIYMISNKLHYIDFLYYRNYLLYIYDIITHSLYDIWRHIYII